MADARFFGDGLKYLNPSDLKGKLIAIEGTDGVGRTTHIEMLQEWLEVQGYGVMITGWTRSNLMSKAIEMAKAGNILDRWSLSLLYATDFADRLEHGPQHDLRPRRPRAHPGTGAAMRVSRSHRQILILPNGVAS